MRKWIALAIVVMPIIAVAADNASPTCAVGRRFVTFPASAL